MPCAKVTTFDRFVARVLIGFARRFDTRHAALLATKRHRVDLLGQGSGRCVGGQILLPPTESKLTRAPQPAKGLQETNGAGGGAGGLVGATFSDPPTFRAPGTGTPDGLRRGGAGS